MVLLWRFDKDQLANIHWNEAGMRALKLKNSPSIRVICQKWVNILLRQVAKFYRPLFDEGKFNKLL